MSLIIMCETSEARGMVLHNVAILSEFSHLKESIRKGCRDDHYQFLIIW